MVMLKALVSVTWHWTETLTESKTQHTLQMTEVVKVQSGINTVETAQY